MTKTTIFVMTHKKTDMPKDPCYVPLHVGKNGTDGFGYMGDDTGDNISALNCHYGELTGLYWIWKNYQGKENIGICHYRRFFTDPATRHLLTEEQYGELLERYDIVTSMVLGQDGLTNMEAYSQAQNRGDMERAGEIINELYPQDRWAFDEVMRENGCSFGNLMVTSRKFFDEYCSWVFGIFEEMDKDMDFEKYPDDYHRRVYGFLSETLLNVWVRAKRLNVCHQEVGVTTEKAETMALKQAVGQLLKGGAISEARQLFYDVMRVRPDVALANADLKGEMFIIEQLLYIMELEKEAGISDGFLFESRHMSLPNLIDHFNCVSEWLVSIINDGKEKVGCVAAMTGGGVAMTGGGVAMTGGGVAMTGGGVAMTGSVAVTAGDKLNDRPDGVSLVAAEVIARNNPALQPFVERIIELLK